MTVNNILQSLPSNYFKDLNKSVSPRDLYRIIQVTKLLRNVKLKCDSFETLFFYEDNFEMQVRIYHRKLPLKKLRLFNKQNFSKCLSHGNFGNASLFPRCFGPVQTFGSRPKIELHLVMPKKILCRMEFIFWSCTKSLGLAQYVNQFQL